MSKSDLEIYSVYFDEFAYIRDVLAIIDSQLDILYVHMDETICEAIAQNTEASDVMIEATLAQVREISRSVSMEEVSIEVGVDEGDISGGLQGIIRVLVTLHGNGHIVTKPGEGTWKKDVAAFGKSGALSIYSIPQFHQGDHSREMMAQFEQQIKPYAEEFVNNIIALAEAIDYEKYLRIG